MAGPLRIEYWGTIYHVLSRGDRREAIFRTDADRKLFLDLLGQTCRRTGWQIHAYCLMDNHFHLLVETPRSNLSAGWTKAELRRRRKGDETKIALARKLREETAVSLRWIAENLYMGTWTHVSNRLYHCH